MENLIKIFTPQIQTNPQISQDILNKVEFRRVWSGELIQVGDRVLYALILITINGIEQMVLMSLLEREIPTISTMFEFIRMENDTLPVLKKIK